MSELYRVDSPINRDERNNLNATFQDIQQEIGKVVIKTGQIQDVVDGSLTGLQSQIDTLVVDGDSSPEAAQARVGADGEIYNTLKGRLDVEFEKNENSIERRGIDITKLGAIGNDATKDTAALIEALANYNEIFVPEGTFLINQTLHWRSRTKMFGFGTLKFIGTGDMIVADNSVVTGTSYDFAEIDGITFEGDKSLGVTQNCFNNNGFHATMKNCFVKNFSGIAMNTGGVTLDWERVYFAGNNTAFNIKDLRPNVHSTMFTFTRCNFNYNTLAITNLDNGQTLAENVIHLEFDFTVFEKNTKHFKLRPFDGVMKNAWIEGGTVPSETWDYRWIMENVRFNAGDPGITYQNVEPLYTGSVKIGNQGDVKAKFLDTAFFNNAGQDVGRLRVNERYKDVGEERYLGITNKNSNKTTLVEETFSNHYNIGYPIVIKDDGTIMRNPYSAAGHTITVEKLRTGVYLVSLGASLDVMPIVEVSSAISQGGPTAYDVPTFYHTTRSINDTGNNYYNDNNLTNKFVINTFSRLVDASNVITDAPADARIYLYLKTSRR